MNIEKIITDYLTIKTNHAILLTGKWGTGKTYYLKNELFKKIEDVERMHGFTHYHPIHVSLFGVDSIDDLQKQMLVSIFPVSEDKAFKIPAKLFKALGRGIFSMWNLGDIDKYLKDLETEPRDIIKFERLVFFFDDLERIGSGLSFKSLMGYINDLVENYDAKVILVANADKIESDEYNELKEKLIGLELQYSSNFEQKAKEIIASKFSDVPEYINFLENHNDSIFKLTASFDGNLRTLIFALDVLYSIYTHLFQDKLSKGSLIQEKADNIVYFALTIAIEFRIGNLSFYNREIEGSKTIDLDIALVLNPKRNELLPGIDHEEEKEKPYRQKFREKYYDGSYDDFKYYASIYDFITGRISIDFEKLEEEIKEAYHIKDGTVLPQYKILDQLRYFDCFELSDKEYKRLTRRMISHAKNGDYEFYSYMDIYRNALRFDNLLSLDIERLKKDIISGLKKSMKQNKYVPYLDKEINFFTSDKAQSEELKEIKAHILKCNNELLEKGNEIRAEQVLSLLYDRQWGSFINQCKDKFKITPIFKYASPYKVFITVNNSEIKNIHQFLALMTNRYDNIPLKHLHDELEFLKALRSRFDPNKKIRQKKTLKNYLYRQIYERLTEAIGRFS